MAKNQAQIEYFLQESRLRGYISKVVRGAEFDISYVHAEGGGSGKGPRRASKLWSLWLKPLPVTSRKLGISQEIMLTVSEHPDLQVRTLEYARHQIERENRLSGELCIVISADPATPEKVREMSHADTVHFVGLSIGELSSFPPVGERSLIQELQSRHFTKNIYDISTAITSRLAFYGREQMLREIGHSLQTTSGHVGLFGLRKMGKTSVLLRTLEYLQKSSNVACAHVDVQRIDAIRQEAGFFLWSLGQQLVDSNRGLRTSSPLKLFGRFDTYSDVGRSEDAVFELFSHDLELIVAGMGGRRTIVFLIDEVEHLLPSGKSRWGNAFVRIWRLLRGISQMHPERVAYFISGTSPICVESPQIDGHDNPAYNFFKKVYLGPFSLGESQKLLEDIGQKIGLSWEPEATQFVHELVGGHPLLLRAFGSRVHKTLSPRRTVMSVSEGIARRCMNDVLLDVNSVLTQMIEVFEEEYPDDYMLLQMLSDGRISEFRDYAEGFPTSAAHLKGYGLVDRPSDAITLNNRLLQGWMNRRSRKKRALSANSGSLPEIDGFELHGKIGHSGGFADVYLATPVREDGSARVALKVLRRGSIAALTREVDTLSSVKSSGVVSIVDYGKSADGSVFLAMELLEGPSLSDFCSPDKRMSPSDAERLLRNILSILESIHPNAAEVERIRNLPEIELEDLVALSEARFGVVHRDIKPENVILVEDRGPVLIDFGISSRVEDPVRTRSATPGYLPSDGNSHRWEVDVDLFALAVTVAQVATGLRVGPEGGLGDICVAVENLLRGHFRDVLLRELTGARSERFSSATAMLRSLSGGVK